MNPNLYAFLCMLRHGEGTASVDGYRVMFGGAKFTGFGDHPRIKTRRRAGKRFISSTAAGAYQFLERTWDDCRISLDLPDFSPASQDKAARYLIFRRGALLDLEAGKFFSAVEKCNKEWASLPGSPYGQPTVTLAEVLKLYLEYGGINTEKE